MSILSSLRSWNANVSSKVRSGVSSAISNVAKAFSGVNNRASASESMTFPLAPGASISPQNMSYAPNMSTNLGPAYGGANGPVYNSAGQQTASALLNTPQTGPVMSVDLNPPLLSAYADYRPSTWTPPVDSQGRQSSASAGQTYVDAMGNTVVPTTGFSGLNGSGAEGFMSMLPQTGTSGTSGSGGRGFGGAGQGSASTPYNQAPSDEQKRKTAGGQDTQVLNAPVQTGPTAQVAAAMQAQGQANPITAPTVPDTIDAGYLDKVRSTISDTMNSGLSNQDKQTVYAQLAQNLVSAKQKLDQQMPTRPDLVQDTPEQKAFIEQSADPFGAKRALDELKASQSSLGDFHAQQIELMKTRQALMESYKPIIAEIKGNPNMPKALARRKIESLAASQKETMQGILDQLDIVNQQISNANQDVNQKMGIVNSALAQENRAQDNARANLQWMVSSGSIAGMSADEIRNYSQATGIPAQSIQAAKEAALNPKVNAIQRIDERTGDWVSVDERTGKELWRIKGFSTPTVSTQAESGSILSQLNASKTIGAEADGQYADPNLYAKLRSSAKMSASEFDNRFGYLVNPASKGPLGVGGGASTPVTPEKQLSAAQLNLLNQAKATIDAAKQKYQYSPALREQIIQKAKSLQNGFDLSPYI